MKKLEAQQRVLEYLFSKKGEEGFTLVELIVVVVIIGILSAIAIPSFQNASDKAKQKEASILISSYIKGAQSFYIEHGQIPKLSSDFGEYVAVYGCSFLDRIQCENDIYKDLSKYGHQQWFTSNRLYSIRINYTLDRVYINATPAGEYRETGYGVTGCFNMKTGNTRVRNLVVRGEREVREDREC